MGVQQEISHLASTWARAAKLGRHWQGLGGRETGKQQAMECWYRNTLTAESGQKALHLQLAGYCLLTHILCVLMLNARTDYLS